MPDSAVMRLKLMAGKLKRRLFESHKQTEQRIKKQYEGMSAEDKFKQYEHDRKMQELRRKR